MTGGSRRDGDGLPRSDANASLVVVVITEDVAADAGIVASSPIGVRDEEIGIAARKTVHVVAVEERVPSLGGNPATDLDGEGMVLPLEGSRYRQGDVRIGRDGDCIVATAQRIERRNRVRIRRVRLTHVHLTNRTIGHQRRALALVVARHRIVADCRLQNVRRLRILRIEVVEVPARHQPRLGRHRRRKRQERHR